MEGWKHVNYELLSPMIGMGGGRGGGGLWRILDAFNYDVFLNKCNLYFSFTFYYI
jgi:hypothetical protein